ncbi:hypothetical protein PG985_006718 [Apiospora marii]
MSAVVEDFIGWKKWKCIAEETYARVLYAKPMIGRIYHRMAMLQRPAVQSCGSNDILSAFFYETKALLVQQPYFPAQDALLSLAEQAVARSSTTESGHFATAVAHLLLSSQTPEDHISTVSHHHALKEALRQFAVEDPASLKSAGSVSSVQSAPLHPSAMLGILLCQLLLGIPTARGGGNPLMAAWAPDFVSYEDCAELAATVVRGHDVYDKAELGAQIMSATISKLLRRTNAYDIELEEFIHVLLVFMRAMKARPKQRERLGYAFHPELMAPILTQILRQAETQGITVNWETASQQEFPAMCMPLNEKYRPDKVKMGHRGAGMHQTNLDATKRLLTNPLPEDELLRGHFFARDAAKPRNETMAESIESASTTKITKDPFGRAVGKPAGVFTVMNYLAEIPLDLDVESQADKVTKMSPIGTVESSHLHNAWFGIQTDLAQLHNTWLSRQTDEIDDFIVVDLAEKIMQADIHTEGGGQGTGEAQPEKAESHKATIRDPPLFPANWFEDFNYSFEKKKVQETVQKPETVHDRWQRMLSLVPHLMGDFFALETDKNGCPYISVPGALPDPQPGFEAFRAAKKRARSIATDNAEGGVA